MRLFTKLLIGFLLVGMAPMAAGVFYFSSFLLRSQKETMIKLGQASLELAVADLADRTGKIEGDLSFLVRRLEGKPADLRFLRLPYEKNREIQKILVADPSGRVLTSLFRYGNIAPGTPTPHGEFSGERFISFTNWNLEPQLEIIHKIRDPFSNHCVGYLHAEISLKSLLAGIEAYSSAGEQYYIVSRDGKIVSHADIDLVLKGTDVHELPVVAAAWEGKSLAFGEYLDVSGQPVVGMARQIPGLPLLAVREVSRERAYLLIDTLRKNSSIAFAAAAVMIFLLAWLISRSITGPMKRLTAGAGRIAAGELDFSLGSFPRDEVGEFADHFNRMVADLKEDRHRRRLAEENLRLSEQRYRTIADFAYDMETWRDPAGKFLFVSPSCKELTGYAPDEFLADPLFMYELVIPEDRDIYSQHRHQATKEGSSVPIEFRIRRKDGEVRWLEHICRPVTGAAGEDLGVRGSNRDITGRKRMEEILSDERERLAVTLHSIGDGVISVDTRGRVVMMNQEAKRMTGWDDEQALGRPLAEIFTIIDEHSRKTRENPVEKALAGGGPVELANGTVLVARDGSELVIGDSAAPIIDRQGGIVGVVLVFRDLTEKKRLQEQMLKADKMESIGLLAGGIAHDFNNLLQGISGNLTMAQLGKTLPIEVDRKIAEAQKAVERASGLTRQLLTFSRGGAPVAKEAPLPELIRESVNFVLHGSTAKPVFHLADDLHRAVIDVGQISQVIHNLALNAKQAMSDGGEVEIRAENIRVEKQGQAGTLPAGDYVKVSVRDQGTGITREIMAHIFDPYFSTKPEGRGLGLASCYSIINNHQGWLTVFSEPGEGAAFIFYLPAASGNSAVADMETQVSLERGTGKILVMDDESFIREVLAEMLEFLGYESGIAADGREAVEAYRQAMADGQPFAAVITDLTVPGGMGGKEMVAELLKIDPAARVIVSSGYAHGPVMANFADYGFKAVIVKPYKMEELSRALHEVL